MPRGKPSSKDQSLVEPVAGNGLLDRRFFSSRVSCYSALVASLQRPLSRLMQPTHPTCPPGCSSQEQG